jgi:hypothetical protein
MGSGLKYRAGLCLIVAVVLIWVISAEVTQVRFFFLLLFLSLKPSSVLCCLCIYLFGDPQILVSWFGNWDAWLRYNRKFCIGECSSGVSFF